MSRDRVTDHLSGQETRGEVKDGRDRWLPRQRPPSNGRAAENQQASAGVGSYCVYAAAADRPAPMQCHLALKRQSFGSRMSTGCRASAPTYFTNSCEDHRSQLLFASPQQLGTARSMEDWAFASPTLDVLLAPKSAHTLDVNFDVFTDNYRQ